MPQILQKVMPLVPSVTVTKKAKKPIEQVDPLGWRRLVGRYISDTRVTKGMTQGELADLAGMSQGDLSSFENGRKNINSANIDKLLAAFDTDAKQMALALADIVLHPERPPLKIPAAPSGATADGTGYKKGTAAEVTVSAPSRSEKRG